MDENDTHLPALAVCHGVSCYPETKKLAAFTGDRFFRSLAASNRCKPSQEDASLCVPASEAAATTMLFQVLEGEARSSLAMPEMLDLVATAKFCMADSIVAALPLYYGAAMQQMNAHEVRAYSTPMRCLPDLLPARAACTEEVRVRGYAS